MTGRQHGPAGNRRYVGPTTIAQAIEAFTKCADLSSRARLLGCELVSRFNPHTNQCFPSEKYLAKVLGCSERQLAREKNNLRQAGLIDWTGAHRGKSCSYTISWGMLRERLHAFREEWKAENVDDNAGQDGQAIDDNAGQIGSESLTGASPLLSLENSKQNTRPCEGASTRPEDDRQQPSELTGCNGCERSSSKLTAQHVAAASLDAALDQMTTDLATNIRNKISDELFDQAVHVCAEKGFSEALRFIFAERRGLGKRL